MPLETGTLTFSLTDLIGSPVPATRTRVWIETNLGDDTIIDTSGNSIRLGKTPAAINADGSGSFANLPLSSAREGLQYRVWVEYPDARGRQQWSSGYFTFSASGDLADQEMEPDPAPVPWEYPVVQAAEAAKDDAVAAQEAAEAAQAAAEARVDFLAAPANTQVASYVTSDGPTKTALNEAIAASGNVPTTYTWDPTTGFIATITEHYPAPIGDRVTTYSAYGDNGPTHEVDPDGGAWTLTYDTNGNPTGRTAA